MQDNKSVQKKEYTTKYTIPILLRKELIAQFTYLNWASPGTVEWSGLLIYKVLEGSIVEPEKLKLEAVGMYPMNFGTSAFTSFEGNDDWLKAFKAFPQIDPFKPEPGWYVGKVHSHNTMQVFHSSTDIEDLHNSAVQLPMFLSLIVNYACAVDCKLAIEVEVEEAVVKTTLWKLKGWAKQQKSVEKSTSTPSMLYTVNCIPTYEQESWFTEQVAELKKPKPVAHQNYPTMYDHNRSYSNPYKGPSYSEPDKDKKGKSARLNMSVYQPMLDSFAEFCTLGTSPKITPFQGINTVSMELNPSEVERYMKALKAYYVPWYARHFTYNKEATPTLVLELISEFIQHHRHQWAFKYINQAINELEKEHPLLQPVQGSSVV